MDGVESATGADEAHPSTGKEALECLYAQHVPPLRRSLLRRFVPFERRSGLRGADIEDAIQEAFAKLLAAGWASAQRPECGSAVAYLAGTVRNLCLDCLRAQRREQAVRSRVTELAGCEHDADDPAPEESEWERSRLEMTRAHIAELPSELAEYFEVRFARGLSQRQAARHLGLTRRRVRTLEHRLLTAVARRLNRVATEKKTGPARQRQRLLSGHSMIWATP